MSDSQAQVKQQSTFHYVVKTVYSSLQRNIVSAHTSQRFHDTNVYQTYHISQDDDDYR